MLRPREVARMLADQAREALSGLDGHDLPDSAPLVQTLYYGLFCGWVLWCGTVPVGRAAFDSLTAARLLDHPVLERLFADQDKPGGLRDLLDQAAAALARVDETAFFREFPREHAVQYFYEPFLDALDPALRKRMGVWYTPPEVVDYMVERIDRVLRDQLSLADGLADAAVGVVDPCAGTGSFLLAVLRRIERTLAEKYHGHVAPALAAAMARLRGLEILPAPMLIAHVQLRLLLETHGVVGHLPAAVVPGSALAVDSLTTAHPVLVVLGNPPYNGYAGLAMDEETDSSPDYRRATATRQPEGQGLNDLYVRFFHAALRAMARHGGPGVVCLISNSSWLDGLSFSAMRERHLEVYDHIWIDNLNGDKYRTGKLTPDGAPDPSIFSTRLNRDGIQVGTAIALMARRADHRGVDSVRYRDLWGRSKLKQLLSCADQDGESLYQRLRPLAPLGLPFTPGGVSGDYLSWPRLPDLLPVSFPGVKTARDSFLVDIDRDRLVERMERYFDPAIDDATMERLCPPAMRSTPRFSAHDTRRTLMARGFLRDNIVRYAFRPFDMRWLYWEPETKLLDEKRSDYASQHVVRLLDRDRARYVPHVDGASPWLVAARKLRREAPRPQIIRALGCSHLMESGASCFPLLLRDAATEATGARPNLGPAARAWLKAIGGQPEDLFHHIVAMLHAPALEADNGGALRQDWPRLPLPANPGLLRASAALGRKVAALLDPDVPVEGVTIAPRPDFLPLGGLARRDGTPWLSPPPEHLRLQAGWGRVGHGGVTMPGPGKAPRRDWSPAERAVLGPEARTLLGPMVRDVLLDDHTCWRCVPDHVWTYTLGGYQVIKKWLSYREHAVLGRLIILDEARFVTAMVRRVAALVLLRPHLDASYHACRKDPWRWCP